MSLLRMRNITLSFGGPPVLDGVDLTLHPGERVCLVGRNGEGKSSLMGVILGELTPDGGEVGRRPGLRVARLAQEPPQGLAGTLFDVVAGGLGEAGPLLQSWHRISRQLAEGDHAPAVLAELERVQHQLESVDGWQLKQRVETVLSRLSLPAEPLFDTLSGGLKRRGLLARALVAEPDLLLLDEPTNHLDLAAIEWLEGFLSGYGGALLFITHDRRFLQQLATRIVELDRGRLTDYPGDYATYLARKAAALEEEAARQQRFDKQMAQEEVWIRQGIKARRTRNEGRVRALERMRRERSQRRERSGTVRLSLQEAERSGKLVLVAEGVTYGYGDAPLIQGLDTTIMRGDKVGIIGPNGCGKTTLIKLLLGELTPQGGEIRFGTRLEVAYFDQLRAALNPDETVEESVAEGRRQLTVNGQPRHVISYLQDFLFSPDRARSPVRYLSGGERNRLLLARLFLQPANLLVMDEPTNDLDVETLELLEELLVDYPGTLLLVSHDRAFLDNVVTSTLVFEGAGRVAEYVGGYEDWLRQRPPHPAPQEPPASPRTGGEKPAPSRSPRPDRPRRLGFKEQRELETLPGHIEALEAEQEGLHQQMADPAFYKGSGESIAAAQGRLEELDAALEVAYARWEELEALAG